MPHATAAAAAARHYLHGKCIEKLIKGFLIVFSQKDLVIIVIWEGNVVWDLDSQARIDSRTVLKICMCGRMEN